MKERAFSSFCLMVWQHNLETPPSGIDLEAPSLLYEQTLEQHTNVSNYVSFGKRTVESKKNVNRLPFIFAEIEVWQFSFQNFRGLIRLINSLSSVNMKTRPLILLAGI